jgi:hypothetical protein
MVILQVLMPKMVFQSFTLVPDVNGRVKHLLKRFGSEINTLQSSILSFKPRRYFCEVAMVLFVFIGLNLPATATAPVTFKQ